jgi:hypothetical protein
MVRPHHFNRIFDAAPAENDGFVWIRIRIKAVEVYEGATPVSSYLSHCVF